jgi:hypothetical protein
VIEDGIPWGIKGREERDQKFWKKIEMLLMVGEVMAVI